MTKLTKLHWLSISIIVAAIFSSIAYYVYQSESDQIRNEKFAYLEAIANLKVDQISKWRTERISEAHSFPSYEKVIYSTQRLLKNRNDEESNNYLNQTLRPIQQRHNYKDIFITDLDHRIIFTLNKEFSVVDTLTINAIHESISKDSIIFNEFYYCKTHSEIHLDIVSPIKNNNKLIGVMVFRFDPHEYLYPLIQKWPTPSQSAECAIVTDTDTQIRILSDVRFKENAKLNLTVTKSDTNYVFVKAFTSKRAILEGIDYRRVEVLAVLSKIDNSNWHLVTKIDQDEIFKDIRYKAATITLITIFAFLLFGVLIMFLYKNRQSQVYKDLFFKEKQLNEFQAQTKAITDAAQDAIIMMDEKGNISFWNPAAEKILGYKAEEIMGKNLHKILAPESFHHLHFKSFEKFKENGNGNAVGSISEFYAIKKDGNQIPIELSLSSLKSEAEWHSVGIIRDISERKFAESKLAESEEKFRKAFITSPDSVNINRMKDGMYVSVNEGYQQLTGYMEEEVIGKTSFEINIWNNLDDRKKLVKGLTENGYVQNLEAEFRVKDGTLKYCLMSASIIQLKDEAHILSITRDITERKKIEQALKISEQGYHQIINGMKDAVYVIAFDGQFLDVNKAACDMLEYTGEELVKLSPFDIDDTLSEAQIEQLIARLPVEGIQTFQTTHISKSKKRIPVEIASTIIKYKGKECILSTAKDISSWLKVQEIIYKSESLLNETQRLAKVGGWEWDIENNKMHWTNECFRIHGISQYEIFDDPNKYISKSLECYNETDRPIVMLTFDRCVKEGIPFDLEFQFTNFKNEKLWIRTTAEPVYLENKIVKVIGNIIDITEHIEDVNNLKNSEKRFRELFESMEEGFYLTELVHDENGKPVDCKFIDVNPAHSKITGLKRNDVIGKTLSELFPGLEQVWFDAHIDVAVTGNPRTVEGFVGSLDRYFILHIYSPRKGQCAVLFLDITDRKLVEKKLKETEERWQFAIEGSDDGVWDWNIKTGEVYFSSRWKTMLGYKDDEIKNEIKEWESRVHPQDLEFVLAEISKHLNGESEFYVTEHRMLCKDLSYKWILDRGKILVKDVNGKPLRMVGTHKDITEKRIAEQALLESEERFRGIVEGAPDAIFIQSDQKFAFANNQFCMLLGYNSSDKLIGKRVLDHIHPDYREMVSQRIKKLNIDRTPVIELQELKFLKFDKSEVWVETKGEPIVFNNENGALVFVRDITERKKNEMKIQQLSLAVEQSPATVVITDTNGIIEYVNPRFTDLTQYTSEDVIGKNPSVLKSGHTSNEEYNIMWNTIISGKEWTGAFLNKKKDGKLFWESAKISPLKNSVGKITHFVAIKEDITQRVETEKELEEYRNSLELKVAERTEEIERINKELVFEIEKKEQTEILLHQSLEKEKELNQLKSRFISTASHEFRTPLTTILSSAELIQRYGKKWEEEKYKDHLVRITNSVEYLTNLMDDVLTISRIESGRTAFAPSNINLKELCEKVISDIQLSIAEKHKLNFNFHSKENHFFVDPKQMQIIFQNLLSNAFKYSVDGDKIDFTIETDENFLQIKVSDDGYGISAEDLTHLFEPFYRSLNTESIQGTGLGLTIVKNAVEMHEGTISVNSKLGEGTTFLINIPLGRR